MTTVQKPAISFILPIYNTEKYLVQAIESVLCQPIDKEIILVDDGSTDNSFQIALNYAYRFPFVSVIHQSNQGVSAARNRGLSLARGEYVMFLDSDDFIPENSRLPEAYQMAKEHKANVLKGQFIQFHESAPEQLYKRPITIPSVTEQNAMFCSLREFCQFALNSAWTIQIACFLFERRFLIENHLTFNEQQVYCEDGLFCIELYSCEGKIVEVPFTFLHYRQHHNGITSQFCERRIIDTYQVTQILQEKKATTTQDILFRLYNQVLIIYYFLLNDEIINAQAELQKKYQHLISDEMKALCRSLVITPALENAH